MRSRGRQWAIRSSWGTLLVGAALWGGLQLGRPLWYTDGTGETSAWALGGAGMWQWGSPEPVCELPGPVLGRVAVLPDGRLLYGRQCERGDAELVLFDPAHAGAAPESVPVLCSIGHDLAPAVAADGRLWFASDRPGGLGGFDLYRSRMTAQGFSAPEPVAACNTLRDETDPAPDPRGGVVFVRVDRAHRGGDDGVLVRWEGGEVQPASLFGAPARNRPVDRDPIFSPDGSALWFVRQQQGMAHVVRSARLQADFDPPQRVDASWGSGALRSPVQSDSARLFVQRPAAAGLHALWLLAEGREVLPWWTGQQHLESLLLLVLCAAVAILLLLYLGERWRSLDLVTLCLLLSLLVHLLMMLWLMGVEIAGSLPPGDDDAAAVQVTLSDGNAGGEATAEGAQSESPAVLAAYRPTPAALAAAAPGAALSTVDAAIAAHAATWTGSGVASNASAPMSELHDARNAQPARTGDDASELAQRELAPVAPAMLAPTAGRGAAASESFAVTTPRAAVAKHSDASAQRLAPTPAPLPVPASSEAVAAAVTTVPVRDAAAAAMLAARTGQDAIDVAAASPAVATGPQAPSDPVAARTAGTSAVTPDVPAAAVGQARSSVAAASESPREFPVPSALPLASAPSVALRDAAAPVLAAESAADPAAAAAPLRPAAVAAAAGPQQDDKRAEPARAAPSPASPGAALAAAPASALAPATTGQVASGAVSIPLPAPRERSGGPLAVVRDAPTGSAATAPVTGAAAATGTALAASNLPAVAPQRAPAGRPRRDNPGAGGGVPSVTPPGSALSAPRSAQVAPAASAANLPARAPSTLATPAANMRDAVALAATTAAAAASSSGVPARVDRAPLPALAAATHDARPTRAAGNAEATATALVAMPPGSLLQRHVAALAATAAAPATALSPYSNRFGPEKQKALEQFGGTVETERAVSAGLRYLAEIQRADGGWGDPERWDDKYGFVRVGKSALALLAFLGAGHTQSSNTEHSRVARAAVDFLLAQQDRETGAFGVSSAYGHGIATYALAECFGITKDAALRRPLEDALGWILQHQGPRKDRRNEGGWGYFSPGLQPDDNYARTAITAWMVMALESARLSGIELPEDVLPRARKFVELAWDHEHRWFRYNHERDRLQSAWPTLPASTPAGAFCLLLLGERADTERLQQALGYTVERRPRQYRRYDDDDFVLAGQGNVYFWYYGTLCCFLAGGDAWQRWNERLTKVLPAAQRRDGAFPPIDVYAETAGDTAADCAYTTALCVLSLEVYYRYFTPLLLGR